MTSLPLISAAIAIGLALSLIMAGAWIVRTWTGNSGWVDVVWAFGLGAVGAASALVLLPGEEAWTMRQLTVAGLVAAWSLRLGTHIANRTRKIPDDPRYAKLARQWGASAPRQMFWLLQKQALVSLPLALSILLAAHNPSPDLRAQDLLAILVAGGAILGEWLADHQLRAYKREPAGKDICDRGLWAWSRHPNYFFEWLGWIAYPLFAIDLAGSYPWGWLSLAGPVCMYWLLRHVSGVPPLEQHLLETRYDAYRAYQARTSAFFPLPPKA